MEFFQIPIELIAAISVAIVAGISYFTSNTNQAQLLKTKKKKKRNRQKKQKKKNNVVEALKQLAIDEPYRNLYTFLDDNGKEISTLTFEQVDQAARNIAATLIIEGGVKKGDRVILCYPPGLDFSVGFWGCLYAGAIAIPIYPPYPGTLTKDLPKFHKMCQDSGAKVALTNKTYHLASKMATVKGYFTRTAEDEMKSWPKKLQWFTTDAFSSSYAGRYEDVPIEQSDIAFFQYSSGSTSEPKAIMVSHQNIRSQLVTWESIQPTDTLVSWLPSYHDMGLVGFTIVPVWTKSRCVSMSPISFIKNPALWMCVASKYKASHVCAPNFGYALVARKITDAERDSLDLSNLRQAICAAEPIRTESLNLFNDRFSSVGFNIDAFNCGYGLAETTLVCTGQDPVNLSPPKLVRLSKKHLEVEKMAVDVDASQQGKLLSLPLPQNEDEEEDGSTAVLVGCGKAAPTFTVIIVDPEECIVLNDNCVGEIWVHGDSVAAGYWGKDELTEQVFHAKLKNGDKEYLRTGDLGFCRHGEIFVTGRIKDLIIIRGRNVSPQDIELSAEEAHQYIRPGCTAAFSIERHGMECLVVIAELRHLYDETVLKEITRAMQNQILSDHQLPCYSIVLLKPRTIPKTTSGKIQRHMARHLFLQEKLKAQSIEYFELAASQQSEKKSKIPKVKANARNQLPSQVAEQVGSVRKSPSEIEQWLMDRLLATSGSGQTAGEADDDVLSSSSPWASFGMDSIALVGLSAELGNWLDVVVPPSAFFEFHTPQELANAPGLASGELKLAKEPINGLEDSEGSSTEHIPESHFLVDMFPEVVQLRNQMTQLKRAGLEIPYLDTLTPLKRKMTNYNTYNYLGLAGHPEVSKASKDAITEYGTSMSSSPIVGQTKINTELEDELCSFFRAEAAVLFVGGWVANVTTIDSLVGSKDLILCDALNHNSCVVGQRLSGATILQFPHNDFRQADRILSQVRTKYRRVLIVIEGAYSMDGDYPDLPKFIELKKKHKALLFVDEAHSFGTLGKTGRGICEYYDVHPKNVDVRMGTMSKALGSTGGFILASQTLIQYFKYCSGGFVFSVGLTPANSASALASLKLIQREPQRVATLQQRSSFFFDEAEKANLNMGTGVRGGPVVVIHIGSTIDCVNISTKLLESGINVKPIVYPAVEEGKCRLRFFISSLRTMDEIRSTIQTLKQELSLLHKK